MDKSEKRKFPFLNSLFKNDNVEEGVIEEFFNNIFAVNKTEKQKILKLLHRKKINSLLFYTDVRNIPWILKHGIKIGSDIKLKEDEAYYVWGYSQQDASINLEFENSTRAHFWKWTNDINFDHKNMAIIGLDPYILEQTTHQDWFLDKAQNLVNISENIYPETFSWILVQSITAYKEIENAIKANKTDIDLYFGDKGIVKTAHKDKNKKYKFELESE